MYYGRNYDEPTINKQTIKYLVYLILLIYFLFFAVGCKKEMSATPVINDTSYYMVGFKAVTTYSEKDIFLNIGYKTVGVVPRQDSLASFVQLNFRKLKQIDIIAVSKFNSAKDFYNFYQ